MSKAERARALTLAMALLAPGSLLAQVPTHYDLTLDLDPAAGTLSCTAEVRVKALKDGVDRVELLLNEGLVLGSVHSSAGVASVERVPSEKGAYRYAPDADPVRIVLVRPLKAGEEASLTLSYEGRPALDARFPDRIGEAWTELGLYAAWFPFDPRAKGFTFDVDAKVPRGYVLDGMGVRTRTKQGWHLHEDAPVADVALVGAPNLEQVRVEEGRVTIEHVGLPAKRVEALAREATRTLHTLTLWFGAAPSGQLKLAFAPRTRGGGYARPGFVVMVLDAKTRPDAPAFVRYLAHEESHFWWTGADPTTSEDWMNESFAEYTALLLLRGRFGEEVFDATLARYREAAKDAPPILGVDRNDDQKAFLALYRKGPLVLERLEAKMGWSPFRVLLRRLIRDHVHTTKGLLDAVERSAGPKTRAALEADLKR